MKLFKIAGYCLIVIFISLLIFASKIVFIRDGVNFKYIFPIGAAGCFCLAYISYVEDKKSNTHFMYVTNKKNTSLSLFMGVLLIFIMIIL